MDRIRTLLLARTHMVVLDPDRAASAATRPSRDADTDKLEAELAELGFVMSLDLAMTLRRLPHQTLQELRGWIIDTLAQQLGAHRPHVPLFRTAGDHSLYVRRVLSWLATTPEQPCPWCGRIEQVAALDPCGHLVCRGCWGGGNHAGCPICHRRIAIKDPFLPAPAAEPGERVLRAGGTLALLHLGFDLIGSARQRFERLLARTTPLSPDDRAELEAVIDHVGPKIIDWLPKRIPVRETAAVTIARTWLVSPDRGAAVAATAAHLTTATDVLRVAAVMMGGNPELAEPTRLRSLARGLRRAVLAALDALPVEQLVDDIGRHARLWKRIGERLHPFEYADAYPRAALAFAIVRGTDLRAHPALRERAVTLACVRVEDERARAIAWAGPIEEALRLRNPRSALGRLTHRPAELLRRADHLVRIAQDHQLDALETVVKGIRIAITRAEPAQLLVLGSHLTRRGSQWPRRVFFPHGELVHAWTMPDRRPLLRADCIGAIVHGVRNELLGRAEAHRHFPRAVLDRALVDLLVPFGSAPKVPPAKLAWPRGSDVALPAGNALALALRWDEPANARVDLDLAVECFDHQWRHVATCDAGHPVVGERRIAVHHGDEPTSERVLLDVDGLRMLGARHAMAVVYRGALPFDRLPQVFLDLAGLRFDLRGRAPITIALAIDLAERRVRWLDVRADDRDAFARAGGYRAALAHVGRDFSDLVGTHARPTMWDLAAVHAAARANVVYVRERDGTFRMYRRRDHEPIGARLGRLLSGGNDEGAVQAIPQGDAPTWFALVTGDLALTGEGYVHDGRGMPARFTRLQAADLVADLAK